MQAFWTLGVLLSTSTLNASPAFSQENVAAFGKESISTESYKSAAGSLGDRPELLLSNPHLKRRFLDDLINNQLLADEAIKDKLDQSPEYQQYLKIAREQILARLYVKKYLEKSMSEPAVAAWYEKEKLRFSTREAQVKHIIVKDEANAKKALAELQKNPEAFDQLLEKYAGKNPPGHKGGSMGYVGRGRLISDLEDAVFATKKGGIHPQTIKTSFGWHIVMVTDYRGTDDVPLAEVKSRVLEEMEQALRKDLLHKQREQAGVKINDEALRQVTF